MPEVPAPIAKLKPDENSFYKHLSAQGLISTGWLNRVQHPNGKDHKITVRDVWELHKRDHLPTVTESTRINKEFRCSKFLPPIFDVRPAADLRTRPLQPRGLKNQTKSASL